MAHDLAFKAGVAVAARYLDSFERLYARLATYPDSGALRPVLGASVRIGVKMPYLVIYEYDAAADTVTILRVVHGRRKVTGRMLLSGGV